MNELKLRTSELLRQLLTFSYYFRKFDVEECRAVVHEAIKKGINLIDTAAFYGHGVSEEVLGKVLV